MAMPQMRVCLVSDNPAVIPQSDVDNIEFHISCIKELRWNADLYIWDYFPGMEKHIDKSNRPPGFDLVLADAEHLDALGNTRHAAFVLLKPINPYTFNSFLRLGLQTFELQQQAQRADQLRSDRDTLLRYALELNLKLQVYDQERGNFLARGVHDFRTPLTALHGYCGLLAEEKLGPLNDRQKQLLERMRYSASRLTRMARGMITLLTQGRFETIPHFNASDITEPLKQALHDAGPFIKDKNISVKVELQPALMPLHFEAEQIQQVFINLLENSCKFVPRHGSIEIRGFPVSHRMNEPAFYQVDIKDSGPGIAPELVDKIFEQYQSYRGSDDRSGGGLGLAICKVILKAHGGSIWATPERDGARFSFQLPFDCQHMMAGDRSEPLLAHGLAC